MKISSPVLHALARHYEQSEAGKTGLALLDVKIDLEQLLLLAHCEEGDAREMAERQLREAAAHGVICLEPAHRRDPNTIAKIRLSPNDEAVFYRFINQVSPMQQREEWEKLFQEASRWPVPAAAAQQWKLFCLHRAERARHWKNMKPFHRDEIARARELLQILARLLTWKEPEHFVRAASCRICGDSKRLERQRGALECLLIEATSGRISSFSDLGILETPRHALVSGPIRLLLDGQILDCSKLQNGAGISDTTLAQAQIECQATRCITVENKTSFHQRALQYPNELHIHTSYPNIATLALLRKLPATMEFLHWGDTDPKGFDILRELRESTRIPITSHRMEYRAQAGSIPLTPEEHRLALALSKHPLLEAERPALEAMLAHGRKGNFEQEAQG